MIKIIECGGGEQLEFIGSCQILWQFGSIFRDIWCVLLYCIVSDVYLKTAFIVLTFIPGNSIVFASGALVVIDKLDPWILLILFFSQQLQGIAKIIPLGYSWEDGGGKSED